MRILNSGQVTSVVSQPTEMQITLTNEASIGVPKRWKRGLFDCFYEPSNCIRFPFAYCRLMDIGIFLNSENFLEF